MNIVINKISDEELALIYKGVADPVRIQMLRLLKNEGTAKNVTELRDKIPLSFTTLAYHATFLHNCGLIRKRKQGRDKFLEINEEIFKRYLPGFLENL